MVFYRLHRMLLGPVDILPSFAGLVAGSLIYDMIHYAVDHVRPRTPIGRPSRSTTSATACKTRP